MANRILFFALGRNGKVELLCSPRGKITPTSMAFYVHNGCWYGRYYRKAKFMTIDNDPKRLPIELLWQGDLPKREVAFDYNEAIEWIETEIGGQ
jgi:hypothetical protein